MKIYSKNSEQEKKALCDIDNVEEDFKQHQDGSIWRSIKGTITNKKELWEYFINKWVKNKGIKPAGISKNITYHNCGSIVVDYHYYFADIASCSDLCSFAIDGNNIYFLLGDVDPSFQDTKTYREYIKKETEKGKQWEKNSGYRQNKR